MIQNVSAMKNINITSMYSCIMVINMCKVLQTRTIKNERKGRRKISHFYSLPHVHFKLHGVVLGCQLAFSAISINLPRRSDSIYWSQLYKNLTRENNFTFKVK